MDQQRELLVNRRVVIINGLRSSMTTDDDETAVLRKGFRGLDRRMHASVSRGSKVGCC